MDDFKGIPWPPLNAAYLDEFGVIDPEVYTAAGHMWRKGERFALSAIGDAAAGLRLMMRAAAVVTRKRTAPGSAIENLNAYLFQTYKHLVLAVMEKENGHRRLDLEHQAESASAPDADSRELERRILLQQIVGRMDDWMREVFELLTLGYTYEEIGRLRRERGNVVRSRFSKQLRQLVNRLEAEGGGPGGD
jgi:DNA-directed RNA polymerase specialized sigma24 family protein